MMKKKLVEAIHKKRQKKKKNTEKKYLGPLIDLTQIHSMKTKETNIFVIFSTTCAATIHDER